MRGDEERLRDVLEAIERIEKYSTRGRSAFESDELIQTWILHYLQIIGEACRSVSDELQNRFPDIPWPKIAGMRNILVHQYFGIDKDAVWAVVENEISPLRDQIEQVLDWLPDAED